MAHLIYLLKTLQDPLLASVTSAIDPSVHLSFISGFLYFHYSILSYQEILETLLLDSQNTLIKGLAIYMATWVL